MFSVSDERSMHTDFAGSEGEITKNGGIVT